jgi:UDP-2-acetamido-3-amino-2,3-dideoxy-glucuronate N-acetyltransferase
MSSNPNIQSSAVIDPNVEIHPTATVWHHAVIREGTTIGEGCVIGSNVYIGSNSRIGAGTRIQHGAFLPDGSIIGKRVFIGPNVTITDDRHPVVGNTLYKHMPPTVEDDVSIGAGAVLLPGIILYMGCVVGAGTVVTKDVHRNITVVGNPARTIQEAKNGDIAMRRLVKTINALLLEWPEA